MTLAFTEINYYIKKILPVKVRFFFPWIKNFTGKTFIFVSILFHFSTILRSDGHRQVQDRCLGELDLETIILCTLDHSPEYRMAKNEWEASLGRKKTAGYLFPNNPIFSTMASNRRAGAEGLITTGSQSVINGEILFSQEIYIGGQRQARMKLADEEMKTALKRIQAMERVTISSAIQATIQYQAAEEEYQLSKELHLLSREIARFAKARFEQGLGTEMDFELAESEAIQLSTVKENSRRNRDTAFAEIVVMMGIPFQDKNQINKKTKIFPIPEEPLESYIHRAEKSRPDLESLKMEIQIAKSRIRVLERDRIPNLTISGFALQDGFNEQVVGARVSIPLRIWRDNSGEIMEAEALAKKSQSISEVGEHTVRLEAIKAWHNYNSLKRAWESYPPNLLQKTNENLNIVKRAIRSGNISVRDAIITQKSLIELKGDYFRTKAGYALSTAEYLRVGGFNFSEYLKRGKK